MSDEARAGPLPAEGIAGTSTQAGGAMPAGESEESLWRGFVDPRHVEGLLASWLALLCRRLGGVRGGLVLLGPPDTGPYAPAATWPAVTRDLGPLIEVARRVLAERSAVTPVPATGGGGAALATETVQLGVPIEVMGRLRGAVVIEAASRSPTTVQELLRGLHWGMAWVELALLRGAVADDEAVKQRVFQLIDLAAIAIDRQGFRGACTALATEVATRLGCDRASIGFVVRGRVRLQAMSHSANFGERMNLVHMLEAAMAESLDQRCAVVHPGGQDDSRITRAHVELSRAQRSGAVCTAPIRADGEDVGAITVEHGDGEGFDATQVELLEALAALVGPVLELKRRDERWIGTKIVLSLRRQLVRLLGAGYLGRKLAAIAALLLVAFLATANGDYRVTAEAIIEGAVRHAAVAPRAGFVAEAQVRPGDIVRAGDPLSTLDDRELHLERLRVSTERAQLVDEHRDAAARHQRVEAQILTARIRQADAQLALLDSQLERSVIRAPFDAIVVGGDLSQSLGAPVERGQVLFDLAPLDRYRVNLLVDERHVADVSLGQSGELVLTALPQQRFTFTVARLTPVATAREGRNLFRVEAQADGPLERLRPGMEGIGKIRIAERRLVWIWTHDLFERLRLWTWRWLP